MEVALTFGSLGDIIAVCQLAIHLGRAIGNSQYGSAKEYQALRKDLDGFVKVLMQVRPFYHLSIPGGMSPPTHNLVCAPLLMIQQVVATYPQREFTPYLEGLDTATKETVDDCAGLIREALCRWQKKYHQALSPSGSGNALKDAGRKMEWFLREQERVVELQAKLSQSIQRLTLLSALAAR